MKEKQGKGIYGPEWVKYWLNSHPACVIIRAINPANSYSLPGGNMNIEDLTIGIEEEYQIIDPETGKLTSFITEFLDKGAVLFREQVKPEFLQSQIEIGSHVCRNIKEARQEVTRLRSIVSNIARKAIVKL